MCRFASGIAVRVSETEVTVKMVPFEHSHEKIRAALNIRDDSLTGFARFQSPVELVPVRGLYDPADYDFIFDAGRPDWWTDSMTQQATDQMFRVAVEELKSKMFSGSLDMSGCDLSKVTKWPKKIGGSLVLRGCDLSKVTKLELPKEIGGSLDMSGCDLSKVTKWPEKIGGSLDMSGCDLSKVTKLELPKEIGGYLDLRGCDLSKVTKWPEKIGGSLDLRGCDLSKVTKLELPKSITEKIIH